MSRIQGASIAALLALATATAHADTVLVNTAADEDNLIGTQCSLREAVRYIHEKNIIEKDLAPVENAISERNAKLEILKSEKKQLEVDIVGTTGAEKERLEAQLAVVNSDMSIVESELAVWELARQGIENQVLQLQVYGCIPKSTSGTDEIVLGVRDDAFKITRGEILIRDSLIIGVDTSSASNDAFTINDNNDDLKPAVIQVENKATTDNRVFRIDDGVANQAIRIIVKLNNLEIRGCQSDSSMTNDCADKGGIIHNREELTLTNVTLTRGAASEKGGALYNDDLGLAQVVESSLIKNKAPAGAAVYSELSGLGIQRSLLAWNNAITANGTVVEVESSSMPQGGTITTRAIVSDSTLSTNTGTALSVPESIRLLSLTIVANDAGIDFRGLDQNITSSIIAGNTNNCVNVGAIANTTLNPVIKFRFNLFQDSTCPSGRPSDTNIQITGTGAHKLFASDESDSPVCAAPPALGLLCPLGNYGGKTLSHKPRLLSSYNALSESPIVNKGLTDAATSNSGCSGTDQRGKPRTLCDIGAVELVTINTEKQGQDVVSGEIVKFDIMEKIGDGELIPAARCPEVATDPRADLTKDGCPVIVINPSKGSLRFDNDTHQVVYTPYSAYHGYDRFSYSVSTTLSRFSDAVNNKGFTMNATVVAEPAGTFESKSFAGAAGIWSLMFLSGLALIRRRVSRG